MSLSSIGSQSTSSPSTDSASAKKKPSAEADFLRFMKMSPIDRMRAGILKSMHVTEEQLAAMSPAERQKIEDVIKKKIQEAVAGRSSEGGGKSASSAGVEASAGASPMSAGTLGGLIALQAAPVGTSTRTAA